MSGLADAAEAFLIPAGGMSLEAYRRLAYGLDCPACRKSLHSSIEAAPTLGPWPVVGRSVRYALWVQCRRWGCRRRSRFEELGMRIERADEVLMAG